MITLNENYPGDLYHFFNYQTDSVKLSFEIVPDYPHVGPLIEIEELSENFLESDRTELSELLEREVSNNLGMVMVFVILSNVNEWLQLKSESTEQRKIEEKERKKREAEAEEMKRFEGTRVTVESFMAWKRKFDVEMAELEKQKHRDEGGNKKLTGRELFEKDKTMIESDLKFLSEDITLETDEVVVDESLFQEIEDLDLDDLSDGERDCK